MHKRKFPNGVKRRTNKQHKKHKKIKKFNLRNRYERYMISPAWEVKREEFHKYCKSIDKYFCWDCKKEFPTYQIHHTNYANFGNEKMRDLELLCRYCHRKLHDDQAKKASDLKYAKL